jgi:hypothetical protein
MISRSYPPAREPLYSAPVLGTELALVTAMNTMNDNGQTFDAALAAFLVHCDKVSNDREAVRACPLNHATFSTEVGPKFVRVVRTVGGGRSAHCFVERATGLVFKPASWKGPQKNFPRGSIYNLSGVGPYGAITC